MFTVEVIYLLCVVVLGNAPIVFNFFLFFCFFSISAAWKRLKFLLKTLINWLSFYHIHLGIWAVTWRGGGFNNRLRTCLEWSQRWLRIGGLWWHLKQLALALSREVGVVSWVQDLWVNSIALNWRQKFYFLLKRFCPVMRVDRVWVMNLATIYHDTTQSLVFMRFFCFLRCWIDPVLSKPHCYIRLQLRKINLVIR